MYQYLQNVQAYIAPPVTTVFLLGIIWKRVNAQASIVTLFAGLFLLILRLGSKFIINLRLPLDPKLKGFYFIRHY